MRAFAIAAAFVATPFTVSAQVTETTIPSSEGAYQFASPASACLAIPNDITCDANAIAYLFEQSGCNPIEPLKAHVESQNPAKISAECIKFNLRMLKLQK